MTTSNLARYRTDLLKLLQLGDLMQTDALLQDKAGKGKLTKEQTETVKDVKGKFRNEYQRWYTEASAVIRQITPDRFSEFEQLYKGDGRRRQIDITNFNIQDWLGGMQFTSSHHDGFGAAAMRFMMQLDILRAAERRFESALFDIKQVVQAELFDSELEAASEIVKGGFLRGAGAIAGVVLEKHLAQVASNHNISIRKQHPTISDLNDALKNGIVIDIPTWRGIQRLGDVRNFCDHNKGREPTPDEVSELIDGVAKATKTLF